MLSFRPRYEPSVRKTLLSLLLKAGLFQLARILTRTSLRILAYHRFGNEYTTSDEFEKHICFLKRQFEFIDIYRLIACIKARQKLPPHAVLLTVDDGYQDFYSFAFPVLNKYGIPATLFLTADFIDKKDWLWHDIVHYALDKTEKKVFLFNNRRFDLTSEQQIANLKSLLFLRCTTCSTDERHKFIDHMLGSLEVFLPRMPTSDYLPLSWEQINKMSQYAITYGAHTCTHAILSKLPYNEAYFEINRSRELIEKNTKVDVSSFCYPNGKKDDFNDEIMQIVKSCGFICAMTTIHGLNTAATDRFSLRRMVLDGRSDIQFMHDISGLGVMRRLITKPRA